MKIKKSFAESKQQVHNQFIKLNEKIQKLDEKKSEEIHEKIICNGCGLFPFTGQRYVCMQCKYFDYCSDCQKNEKHEHKLVSISKQITEKKNIEGNPVNVDNNDKMRLISFIFGQSKSEAALVRREAFVKKHYDKKLEEFHVLLMSNKFLF